MLANGDLVNKVFSTKQQARIKANNLNELLKQHQVFAGLHWTVKTITLLSHQHYGAITAIAYELELNNTETKETGAN